MKLLRILFLALLAVSTSKAEEDDSRIYKENNWYLPREKSDAIKELKDWSNTTVEFYLYTRKNPTDGKQIFATKNYISASQFNFAHPTRIIIHGHFNTHYTPMIIEIRKAWLELGEHNVIVVDWHAARDRYYSNSALAVPTVGEKIAHFIDYLVNIHVMHLETTHVIGYGLGAHVAGYTGKRVKTGQIHTIIGLNPTRPSFPYDEPSKRLNSTDAYYVETIQTDVTVLGYKSPIGAAAFYPNGGSVQPGCIDFLCDHRRSAIYYAESIIRDSFAAISCQSYESAIKKNCGLLHSAIRMGGSKNPFMVSGSYYVPLNEKSPFGILP